MSAAVLLLASILTSSHQAGDEKPPVDFLKLLVDRSTAVASARATLTTTVTPGRERAKTRLWREAALRYYERVQDRDGVGRMTMSLRDFKRDSEPFEPFIGYHKLAWRGQELRYEYYGLSNKGGGWHRPPEVLNYRDGVWKTWAPSSQPGRPPDFTISDSTSAELALPAYLGLSFFASNGAGLHFRLPPHAKRSGLIPWSLILAEFDTRAARTQRLEGGWLVTLASHHHLANQMPFLRLELRFAAEPPYVLQSLSLDAIMTKVEKHYSPRVRQHWSEFREVGGILVPHSFADAWLVQGFIPEEGRGLNDWVATAHELSIKTTQISELELNVELPDALFEPPALPAGTSVVDKVRGEAYVVGQAGEILERTALAARDLQSGTLWWPWYTGAGALLFAIGLWLFWRWRR
jgi:hypothetical protein